MKNAKNKLREASDQHDEQLHKLNQEHESQVKMKDQIIQRVTETLEDKESIIQVGVLCGRGYCRDAGQLSALPFAHAVGKCEQKCPQSITNIV